MTRILFLCFYTIVFITSCGTRKKTVTNYLENNRDTSGINLIKFTDPVIQKNDLLSIKVYSLTADPAVDAVYNLPETTSGSNTGGFLVDNSGNIEYPRLGTLHVEGLTKVQLAEQVRSRLDTVLKSPTVIVRFVNFTITILGEVRNPGRFNVPTERVTILEAIGMAGDISEYGNKQTIKIMRENGGQASIQIVDLTSKDVMTSPFYQLQQNDIIFVEQTDKKIRQLEQQSFVQQLGIITGIITALALIFNFIR